MLSPGLYSPIDAITSIPGAPDRSARFCSTRCGESVSVCATSVVAMPRVNNATPTVSPRIDRTFFMKFSIGKFEDYRTTKRDESPVGSVHRSPGKKCRGGSMAEILVGRSNTKWLLLNG